MVCEICVRCARTGHNPRPRCLDSCPLFLPVEQLSGMTFLRRNDRVVVSGCVWPGVPDVFGAASVPFESLVALEELVADVGDGAGGRVDELGDVRGAVGGGQMREQDRRRAVAVLVDVRQA
jgi:hypothetical protein